MDFVPTGWFKDLIRSLLNIDEPKPVCNIEEAGVCNQKGSESLGSPDLIENMGFMFAIACCLILIILLMILLFVLCKKCQKGR